MGSSSLNMETLACFVFVIFSLFFFDSDFLLSDFHWILLYLFFSSSLSTYLSTLRKKVSFFFGGVCSVGEVEEAIGRTRRTRPQSNERSQNSNPAFCLSLCMYTTCICWIDTPDDFKSFFLSLLTGGSI